DAEPSRQSMIAWEAIMSLERLYRATNIHKDPVRERRRILRAAGELVTAQSFVWLPPQRDEEVIFQSERLLTCWDCAQLATILNDQTLLAESGYVIVNNVRETSWGVRFPRILNLLAVPVASKQPSGWILAFNKRQAVTRDASDPAPPISSTPG